MKHAFSLVELSIVLVILGLLTGGILTGQNLIRAAELRAVTTEFTNYQTAVHTFRDKYFQIPGDMNNAIDFWGFANAVPATCLTSTGTGTQTCDGDGDGIIDPAAAASQYGEDFTFWQHLANAGLIEGGYTGIAGSGSVIHAVTEQNIPRSKMSNAGWYADTLDNSAGVNRDFSINFGNTIMIGTPVANSSPTDFPFKPEEAWNIDTKIDDGLPGQGKVYSSWQVCTSAASQAVTTATYDLTYTSPVCFLRFKDAF